MRVTDLFEGVDAVPAVRHARGEAGRGGRLVVVVTFTDELGDAQHVRHGCGPQFPPGRAARP